MINGIQLRNGTPLNRTLAEVESIFTTAGRCAPPTKLMIETLTAFIIEAHPDLWELSAFDEELPMEMGFDDEGDLVVDFPPHPKVSYTQQVVGVVNCECGEAVLFCGSVSNPSGVRVVVTQAATGCRHGHITPATPSRAQRPASKKRRKRDARKQAA